MVEVKRRKGESAEAMMRRFNKRIRLSGVLIRAKKNRFYNAPLSDNRKQEATVSRLKVRAENDYLRKIGKLEDESLVKKYAMKKKSGQVNQSLPSAKEQAITQK